MAEYDFFSIFFGVGRGNNLFLSWYNGGNRGDTLSVHCDFFDVLTLMILIYSADWVMLNPTPWNIAQKVGWKNFVAGYNELVCWSPILGILGIMGIIHGKKINIFQSYKVRKTRNRTKLSFISISSERDIWNLPFKFFNFSKSISYINDWYRFSGKHRAMPFLLFQCFKGFF